MAGVQPGIVKQQKHWLCQFLFAQVLDCVTKVSAGVAVYVTVSCCSPGKPLHHQHTLHVSEDHGHLLVSKGSGPKFLWTRTSVMLPLHCLFSAEVS
jgi:hypothetical protein